MAPAERCGSGVLRAAVRLRTTPGFAGDDRRSLYLKSLTAELFPGARPNHGHARSDSRQPAPSRTTRRVLKAAHPISSDAPGPHRTPRSRSGSTGPHPQKRSQVLETLIGSNWERLGVAPQCQLTRFTAAFPRRQQDFRCDHEGAISAINCSRMTYFCGLPVAVIGNSATKRM
jgi:hypothetical protein